MIIYTVFTRGVITTLNFSNFYFCGQEGIYYMCTKQTSPRNAVKAHP